MAVFKAFKPEAMNKIAKAMGYTGDMGQFQDFIEQDPARKARMQQFTNAAVQMAKGGVVKMQTGGLMGAAPAVVVYGPDGQTYGSPQQAMQAGVTNPAMAPPPGVTPIPMQVDRTKGKFAEDAMMGPVRTPEANTPAAQAQQANIGESTVQRMYGRVFHKVASNTSSVTPSEAGQYVDPRTGM